MIKIENREELKFQLTKTQLKEYNNEISKLKCDRNKLNNYYIELLQEKCRENIGRCFKKLKGDKVIAYCKIIDIDKVDSSLANGVSFNEYQYPAIWFNYPYCNSNTPFYEDNLFYGTWGKGNNITDNMFGVSYQEITNDEFVYKFNEINSAWIAKKVINKGVE